MPLLFRYICRGNYSCTNSIVLLMSCFVMRIVLMKAVYAFSYYNFSSLFFISFILRLFICLCCIMVLFISMSFPLEIIRIYIIISVCSSILFFRCGRYCYSLVSIFFSRKGSAWGTIGFILYIVIAPFILIPFTFGTSIFVFFLSNLFSFTNIRVYTLLFPFKIKF